MISKADINSRKGLKQFLGSAFIALSLSAALGVSVAPVEAKEQISILVDHAKVMRISRPAATVIVGNPGIADATVQDSQTLVITGKSFGVTNIIVLDASGEPIADALLTVQGDQVNAVTIYRRNDRISYSCSPNCERSLTLGDNDEQFGSVRDQIEQRNAVAAGTANR